ncbi:TetR/AcrR family transcriptional regulator [Alkalihalophilus lindianensis]|uniref:TetR/AcrR family transcriptional regulator n=1 Tax=Alkalihalophilus lindianensis TaxID=1630542 RepID=A0ABU3X5Y0_9BACI|nr:TetR/AcrR family transcriptional regulator [Alkalihalophilus lindianensis]MDV2683289.1 TetR/AcrR family transcriptional regulator [Alkalihalophilus lindianensis]
MLENKKEIILEAATNSFSMFGYKGTTIDQVAKLANIGKGTIYTSFKSKEELFDAVLGRMIIEIKGVFERAFLNERNMHDNITFALYDLLEFRQKHHLLKKLGQEVAALGSLHAKKALAEVEKVIISCIETQIERGKEQGKINVTHPKVTAFMVYKSYMALAVDFSEMFEALRKDEIINIFKDHLTKGLLS